MSLNTMAPSDGSWPQSSGCEYKRGINHKSNQVRPFPSTHAVNLVDKPHTATPQPDHAIAMNGPHAVNLGEKPHTATPQPDHASAMVAATRCSPLGTPLPQQTNKIRTSNCQTKLVFVLVAKQPLSADLVLENKIDVGEHLRGGRRRNVARDGPPYGGPAQPSDEATTAHRVHSRTCAAHSHDIAESKRQSKCSIHTAMLFPRARCDAASARRGAPVRLQPQK